MSCEERVKKHPSSTAAVFGLFENTDKMMQDKYTISMIFLLLLFLMPSGYLKVLIFNLMYQNNLVYQNKQK